MATAHGHAADRRRAAAARTGAARAARRGRTRAAPRARRRRRRTSSARCSPSRAGRATRRRRRRSIESVVSQSASYDDASTFTQTSAAIAAPSRTAAPPVSVRRNSPQRRLQAARPRRPAGEGRLPSRPVAATVGRARRIARQKASTSSHAALQRRQTSAQMRQCSWWAACRSHSSAQATHAAAQASIVARTRRMSGRVCRVAMRAVASQTSAQSRPTRMTPISSARSRSLRLASAQAVQLAPQSRHSSAHRRSASR